MPRRTVALATLACAFACAPAPDAGPDEPSVPAADGLACAPDNDGLTLPPGFCAVVVADSTGGARHLQVSAAGDVYVALRDVRRPDRSVETGGIVALRDTDGDGRVDVRERWGHAGGNGVVLHDGFLYLAPDDAVLRYRLPQGALTPTSGPDTLVSGLPADRNHTAKSIAVGDDGSLYVNIGSPSNACQQETRTAGSPGLDPCPQLETRAGIWRFRADRVGQTQEDGTRFATGLRNVVALRLHPESGALYGAVHGRDQLSTLWPELYTEIESAEKPAEEFVRIDNGSDFGWPYCYYDQELERKVLAPEYGGDGSEVGRCADAADPLVGFPGHWAPNALAFNTGNQFPAAYRGGAFIAFHGSWNRAPRPQQGYLVAFVPMRDGEVSGDWQIFADGFAGDEVTPGGSRARPTGLAFGPDGSLYISDSKKGRIWRIVYRGA
ncbi:MAG: PQQ-dependent sugar dehydrogenase [Gemmatimonadota bacterium]